MYNKEKNTFARHAEFFCKGIRVHRDEGGVRILLGDNRGGGVVILRPTKLWRVAV
jgi:hypothetical protein